MSIQQQQGNFLIQKSYPDFYCYLQITASYGRFLGEVQDQISTSQRVGGISYGVSTHFCVFLMFHVTFELLTNITDN